MVMSIQHNSMAVNAYRNLAKANFTMGKAMEKLSSGYRINTAADNPADLVGSEQLRARIEGLERAIRDTRTSGNILDITDGALGEVQGILRSMQQLAIHSLNSGVTTADQIGADQAQMDVALQSIDRILNTTTFAGRKLLDNLRLSSGANYAGATGQSGENALVDTSKTLPQRPADGSGGPLLDASARGNAEKTKLVDESGMLTRDMTFTIAGKDGSTENAATYQFTAGTSFADVVAKLREHAISAEDAEGLDPDFTPPSSRSGADIGKVTLSLETLDHIQGMGDADAAEYLSGYMENFSPELRVISGDFQATGKPIDLSRLSEGEKTLLALSESLQNMTMAGLGTLAVGTGEYDSSGMEIMHTLSLNDLYSGGAASLNKNAEAALKIIKQASKDVTSQRANIAATRAYALQANENLLMSELESATRAESYLRDTDMAEAITDFTRSKVVSEVGMKMLAAANASGRSLLNLLA